ncbi:hypothetical protein E2C06_24170 [Dankookia rubra]|uniref:Uncharacterized protein n=1 Tax=Dankookia rubra TaxID=1442381 RepID=A0A4R5QCJ4_9PROT|nr:hypothetical protein E2C06_24170 [Dankookia rubra]
MGWPRRARPKPRPRRWPQRRRPPPRRCGRLGSTTSMRCCARPNPTWRRGGRSRPMRISPGRKPPC